MIETIGGTTVLAVLGVLVLAVSSLAGLVFFVNKEENFEDVVAAQKKEQEALITSLQASGKSKSNKKWNKLKSKKAAKKENAEAEQDSGVDDEEIATESIQSTKSAAPKAKEPTPVKEPELKIKEEKKTEKPVPVKQQKEKKAEKEKKDVPKHTKMVIEEVVSVKEEPKVNAAPPKKVVAEEIKPKVESKTKSAPQPKEDEKKKKPKKTKAESSGIGGVTRLVTEIETLQLNPSEVQQLIDVLLARQSENEQWHKPKGDPVEILKKQLSDIDVQLHEERKLAQGAALKNKELKNELQQERSQRHNFQQMINRYSQQTKELENARKQLEEKHLSEMQSTQAQITRMQQLIDGGSQREFHQLADENQHLKRAQQQVNEEKNKLINDLNQLQKSQQSMKQDYDNAIMQFKQQQEKQQISLQEKLIRSENEHKLSKKSQIDAEVSLGQIQAALNELNGKNQALENQISNFQVQKESVQNSSAPQQDEVSGLSKKLLETEAQLSQSQASMKELLAQVEQKNQQLQSQETTNKKSLDELSQLKNRVTKSQENENSLNAELASVKGSLKDKESQLNDLSKEKQDLTVALEKNKQVSDVVDASALDSSKLKELEDALAEKTVQNKTLEENVELLKKKNNDLREKNWKAIDALGKAEDESKSKDKSLEKTICKSLKSVYPDLKLPKTDKGLQNFFEEFQTSCKQHITEHQKTTNEEIETLKSANQDLQKQLAELDSSPKKVDDDESEKLKLENQKLKAVLGDTEVMLSKLQSGVDAEIRTWSDKVDCKDKELQELHNKLNSMEDTMKEHGFVQEEPQLAHAEGTPTKKKHGWTYKLTKIIHPKMETTLKETQKELEKEKQEKLSLQATLKESQSILENEAKSQRKELEDKLKETQAKLDECNEKLEAANDTSKTDEVNSKLKKTISERDLLIREYKKSKDSVAKFEISVKEKDDQLAGIADVHKKELKKIQDQVNALENTAKVSGKGDKAKDKIIAQLYLEIEELKDDLREERDRVIVDIETPDSENLHRQVETLTTKLQQEKEDKFNLSIKLNDLEKSYQEEQSDKDKVMNLESKLKAAEVKIVELESSQNSQIENEIEEAMKLKQQLCACEKEMGLAKELNKQLSMQLAAASTNGVDIGTTV